MPSSNLKRILTIGFPVITTIGYLNSQPLIAEDVSIHKSLNDELKSALLIVEKPQSTINRRPTLDNTVRKARELANQTQLINGYPGLLVGVSIKGEPVWIQGFGYSNIETGAKCNRDTVMRIASISKPLTMLSVAKLVELGMINLDKNVKEYLEDKFPAKKFAGKPVNITLRLLASHLSGIRHYNEEEKDKIFDHYSNSKEAIDIFKNDDLLFEPGTGFNYSTFAYTVIAAAVESILPEKQTFGDYLIKMCREDLGMSSTYLDENKSIILNRAAQYRRESGKLFNAPYVDCSYKWAGGGILSSVPDLLRFGNIMMYSYLNDRNIPGFLKKSTIELLWTPNERGQIGLIQELKGWAHYGLGWGIIKDGVPKFSHCASPPFEQIFFHTGGATGGTTLLMVIPEKQIVVVLLCNLERASGLMWLGVQIAKIFADYLSETGDANKNAVGNGSSVFEGPDLQEPQDKKPNLEPGAKK